MRFKPDSQLAKEHQNYKNEGLRAKEAIDAYGNALKEIPRRPKKVTGANIAVGGSHPEIKENFTLDERMYSELTFICLAATNATFGTDSRLRGLARTAYQAKRK